MTVATNSNLSKCKVGLLELTCLPWFIQKLNLQHIGTLWPFLLHSVCTQDLAISCLTYSSMDCISTLLPEEKYCNECKYQKHDMQNLLSVRWASDADVKLTPEMHSFSPKKDYQSSGKLDASSVWDAPFTLLYLIRIQLKHSLWGLKLTRA